MPPVSEKQRRAMFAAKAGNSTIGIPQSVGKDFADADPGGPLPTSADSGRTKPTTPPSPKGLSSLMKGKRGPK